MKTNVGNTDRVIRVIAGLLAIALGFYFQSWWGAIGLIFLFTALLGYCPLYAPLGFSTCKRKTSAE